MPTLVDRIDHIVLTVADIEATTRFYERALKLTRETFRGPGGELRHALNCGRQKINLQDRSTATPTKARQPTFGDNTAARGNVPCGLQGNYWIGTFENYDGVAGAPGDTRGDVPVGTLTSPEWAWPETASAEPYVPEVASARLWAALKA